MPGTILRCCVLAACAVSPAFAQTAAGPFTASWVALALDSAMPEPREPKPDYTGEIERNKSYAIPAAEIVGFEILLNRFDNAHYGCCDYRVTMATVRRNLRSSWVVDSDPFRVNQLGHPYQGSMFHGFARAAGLNFWEGFAYSFAGSALWKIAGENTLPSRNDQITTSVGGPVLGEALFRLSNLVLEQGGIPAGWREVAATLISPPVGFNRYAFGDRFRSIYPSRDPLYFTRLQLGFSGSQRGHVGFSTADVRRNEALADFYIDYGLPGDKGYDYARPFDYFSFQATASSANGLENVMTRGMLAGKALETTRYYRGIWGLYGIYDYIAPQTFRVSSTGVALGTTSQLRVSDSMQVLGTLLAGGGYTAAGTVDSSDDRDYHHGVAPQALAALRFIFGTRAAVEVTGREYYISRLGAAQRGGHENIVRVDAALTVRLYKQHGISIKYLGNRRDASYPGLGGDRTQRRQTLGVFYTLLGHDRFGAAEWD